MAGAGYKLFNTGDVLTAAQVNTYLMEQTVMVFADAAARTTALTGVVSEGMISYLKDTNAVEVYNGSAWVSSDDPNAIQNTIVDAKGDLITATAADTPARLAVGNNGETLVADSSASTGLRWQGNFAAGKNKIINGDFNINQRSFTSTTTSDTYGFDRWQLSASDGTSTYSAQTFTAGAAPVSGYEATNYARLVSTGQTATSAVTALRQKIESVRTFANQEIVVSFWAKASTGTPNLAVWLQQVFGSGGSTSVQVGTTKQAISSSWARYSYKFTVPSISGKTIGTNDNLQVLITTSAGSDRNAYTDSLGIQSITVDIWGVQVEAGNVATAFQTATGTLAGELAACQRYAYVITQDGTSNVANVAFGNAFTSTQTYHVLPLAVQMRTAPTATFGTASNYLVTNGGGSGIACTTVTMASAQKNMVSLYGTVASGLTTGEGSAFQLAGSTSASIILSAEL